MENLRAALASHDDFLCRKKEQAQEHQRVDQLGISSSVPVKFSPTSPHQSWMWVLSKANKDIMVASFSTILKQQIYEDTFPGRLTQYLLQEVTFNILQKFTRFIDIPTLCLGIWSLPWRQESWSRNFP